MLSSILGMMNEANGILERFIQASEQRPDFVELVIIDMQIVSQMDAPEKVPKSVSAHGIRNKGLVNIRGCVPVQVPRRQGHIATE